MLPVSEIPAVAEGITFWFQKALKEEEDFNHRLYKDKAVPRKNRAVYLFTLRLPVIDIIEPNLLNSLLGEEYSEAVKKKWGNITIQNKNGERLSYSPGDPGVEAEILFFIGPEEIVSSKKIENPQFEYVP